MAVNVVRACVHARACDIFFIHSSVNGCLGCFHILNKAAVNMGVQMSLQDSDAAFLG